MSPPPHTVVVAKCPKTPRLDNVDCETLVDPSGNRQSKQSCNVHLAVSSLIQCKMTGIPICLLAKSKWDRKGVAWVEYQE